MREKLRFLGMDVHAETIAVAVAEPDGEVRSLGTIANREDSIRKFIRKLGSPEQLRACCEAGPTGLVLYWQLDAVGRQVRCEYGAVWLVPKKPGDKVKTDRRDALEAGAQSSSPMILTAVWIPDEASEALRDLVRAREAKPSAISCERSTGRRSSCCVPVAVLHCGVKMLDGTSCGVAPAGSPHTHPAQEATFCSIVSHEVPAHGRAESSGWRSRIVEVISAGSRVDAGSHSWFTGIAWHLAQFLCGSHDCSGAEDATSHPDLRGRAGPDGV